MVNVEVSIPHHDCLPHARRPKQSPYQRKESPERQVKLCKERTLVGYLVDREKPRFKTTCLGKPQRDPIGATCWNWGGEVDVVAVTAGSRARIAFNRRNTGGHRPPSRYRSTLPLAPGVLCALLRRRVRH